MVFDRGAVAPGVDAGYEGEGEGAMFRGSIFQENIGSQPFMKVNRHGQRFANESTPYDFICFAATYQPGGAVVPGSTQQHDGRYAALRNRRLLRV